MANPNIIGSALPIRILWNVWYPVSVYTLKTCSWTSNTAGRKVTGFVVKSVAGKLHLPLPTLVECNLILHNRNEIPTPEGSSDTHLKPTFTLQLRSFCYLAETLSTCTKCQHNDYHSFLYIQRLALGWVIVGDVFLGGAHWSTVNVFKTSVLENGQPSYFQPYESRFFHKKKDGKWAVFC